MVYKLLDDFAIGSDVVGVLIAFVSSSHFRVAAIDVESFLGSSWFAANLTSFFSVYVVHCVTQMSFSFGLACKALLAQSNVLVRRT